MFTDYIEIRGAREHNLKNIRVRIPKNKLVAITGPSGSGKSTFAMDILQRECQRQYMESMGMVTDGLNKPDVDDIVGLSPAIGVSQRAISSTRKSTVGTYTEILTYLRLLYAKLGVRVCPACHSRIESDFNIINQADIDVDKIGCPRCKTELKRLTMGDFSFNKPEGACQTCSGLGSVTNIDMVKVVDESLTLAEGAVSIWGKDIFGSYYGEVLEKCGRHYGFDFDAKKKVKDYNELEKLVFYHGVDSEGFKNLYPSIKRPKKVNDGYFKGIMTFMKEKAVENSRNQKKNTKITGAFITETCPNCHGTRLGPEGRTVIVKGKTITEICSYDMKHLMSWIEGLDLNEEEKIVSEVVINDLKKRSGNLIKIGLGYLSLDRPIGSLSGGEAQRIKLSNIIDSGLTGVLYILDEPTTGLHPHDGYKLLDALKHIRDLGNTVLVIEHDMDFVGHCDYVIDFGPESGQDGGQIVSTGTPGEIANDEASITGRYLKSRFSPSFKHTIIDRKIEVKNAFANNLKNIDVDIPLNTFVCFTGVSGSGKSSLVMEVINKYYKEGDSECETINGLENVSRIVSVDQKPIGRMTRSNVATYTEIYKMIRELYSSLKEARKNKLKASHFSFNVKGGRCENCQGLGVVKLDMQFLDDVEVKCQACDGHRFKKRILDVHYKGKNISDVLNMTVDECMEHFRHEKEIVWRLANLQEVGLGYLKLGQSTLTLSGGECQRIKLSKELGRNGDSNILYILDEPTTGLHPRDVGRIMELLYKIKGKGNSIFVIEHSLDVIAEAEYIIDLGKNGGEEGGRIIVQGDVNDVVKEENSYTGRYLGKSIENLEEI